MINYLLKVTRERMRHDNMVTLLKKLIVYLVNTLDILIEKEKYKDIRQK